MATGIVSLAVDDQGFRSAALALFAVNAIAYACLWGLGAVRLARAPRAVWRDLRDHIAGPQFLTIVAATAVVGAQSARFQHSAVLAAATWIAATALWIGLTYAFLGGVIVGEHKPRLDQGLDGSWLLLTVSTESLAVLGTLAACAFPRPDIVVFASLVLFLAGAMLYILVIGLIFFRWIFRPMPARTLTPTYWINMGAVAITTLAGARLIETAPAYAFVASVEHFIAGFTLFFWATGTWWIPLLVVVFAWRHTRARTPLHYDAQYWSLVFPLGMYSAATHAYAAGNRLAFLSPLARIACVLAVIAWIATAAGLVRTLLRRLAGPSASD
jgi:tellurite resistance protein TehA-like permease